MKVTPIQGIIKAHNRDKKRENKNYPPKKKPVKGETFDEYITSSISEEQE